MFDWLKNLFGKKDKPAGCCGGGCCSHQNREMIPDLGISDSDKEKVRSADDLVVIGKVVEVRSHGDETMTKVKVTMCDIGRGELVQILCAGLNLEQGQIVAIAQINTVLPGDFQIGQRDIKGETSYGMICASKELGLEREEDDKNIWPLPTDFERFLGKSLNSLV